MQTAEPQDDWQGLLRQGNYLGALRVLEQPDGGNESTRLQSLSWVLGAVGRYREAQRAFNRAMGMRTPPPAPTPKEAEAVEKVPVEPAEQMMLEAARRRQIVLLNETHHQPEHRVFGTRLLPELKAAGLRYLALENGSQAALDAAMKTGRIGLDTDFYAMEAQRAELLRAVLRAGLTVVAIDIGSSPEAMEEMKRHPERSIEIRETAMARNIEERILRRDPSAKVLVWVGMFHACKRPQGGNEWMALRLWKRTGIEPFSIYQMSDTGDVAHDEPIYRHMVTFPRRHFQAPLAVRLPLNGFAGEPPEAVRSHPVYGPMWERGVDAVVLHPLRPFEDGPERPAWLCPEKRAELRGVVARGSRPCAGHLVQALVAGDGDSGAPADQVLTDARGECRLRLRPGRYRIRVWTPAERVGEERVVTQQDVTLHAHQRAELALPVP